MYRLNQWNPAKIDLEKYVFINEISFLDSEASKDTEQLYTFYENKNGTFILCRINIKVP